MDLEELRERARKHAVDGYGSMSQAELEAALAEFASVKAGTATEVVVEVAATDEVVGVTYGGVGMTRVDEDAASEFDEDEPGEGDGLDDLTVLELHERAADAGISGHGRMNKAALIDAIRARELGAALAEMTEEDLEDDT